MHLNGARIIGAVGVVGAAVAVSLITLGVRTSSHCLAASASGNTVIRDCRVRPEWATHVSELLLAGAIVAAVGLLLSVNLVALFGGAVAAYGLAWALGDLFIHWWAPVPTAENSSPPPEAVLFILGSAVAFLIAALSFVALALFTRWSGRQILGRHS